MRLALHQPKGTTMKLTTIGLAAAFALSGTFALAQTGPDGTAGGSAARQDTGDPLIQKPASGGKAVKRATGVTTGTAIRSPGPRPKQPRSEERRVGKECRSQGEQDH